MRNWKTTASGASVIAIAIGHALEQFGAGGVAGIDLGPLLTAVFAGSGLIFAPDAPPKK